MYSEARTARLAEECEKGVRKESKMTPMFIAVQMALSCCGDPGGRACWEGEILRV